MSPARIFPDRPEFVHGVTIRMKTGCGSLYITINDIDGRPYEVFLQLGKAGGCSNGLTEVIGRTVSLLFKGGYELDKVVHQFSGVACPSPIWHEGEQILSCADAVAKALRKWGKEQLIGGENGK